MRNLEYPRSVALTDFLDNLVVLDKVGLDSIAAKIVDDLPDFAVHLQGLVEFLEAEEVGLVLAVEDFEVCVFSVDEFPTQGGVVHVWSIE